MSRNNMGKQFSFVQDGDRFVLSINNHEEIVSALAEFCQEQGILCGEVSGLGAVNTATLRFLDPATKKYVDKTFDEQMEVSSLVGNISEKDGKVYLHVHVNLGRRDYSVVGGHLLCATINGACELIVTRFHCQVDRRLDEETGLFMI